MTTLFKRNMKEAIDRCLKMFPVVVLSGARQCGKTTLARMVRPGWKYFDLEKGDDYDFITADFDFFFRQYPDSIIIDEAQFSESLFRELRGVVDGDRGKKGRFILTGSSSLKLKNRIAETLAGRVGEIELGTLKMNERYAEPLSDIYSIWSELPAGEHLRKLKGLRVAFDTDQVMQHFLWGGYPEISVEDDPEFSAVWMSQYHKTYIQRDIRALFPQLQLENYRRFISMLAELSGTIVNRSEIGRTLNCSEAAVRDYLDIAAGTFILRNLPALERTVSKSIVKMKRGYMRDSGLLHHLLNIRTLDRLYTFPGTGAAFEAFAIEEIMQGLQAVERAPWAFSYYRTRSGAEVDLVLTSPVGERIPCEIKFGAVTRRSDLRSLVRFVADEDVPYGIVFNNAEEIRMITDQIVQIPVGCL